MEAISCNRGGSSLQTRLHSADIKMPSNRAQADEFTGLPAERLSFITADASLRVLLAQKRLAASLPETQARVVFIEDDAAAEELETEPPTKAPNAGST